MVLEFAEDDILELGLRTMGYCGAWLNARHELKMKRFRAAYGTSPIACTIILFDLQSVEAMGDKVIEKPAAINLLLLLQWLKQYPTESVMSGRYCIHEETIRKRLWYYAEAVQQLKAKKVSTYK